jgi:hypothetical protein
LLSRRVIAASSRLFRRIDDGSRVGRFRHGFPLHLWPSGRRSRKHIAPDHDLVHFS